MCKGKSSPIIKSIFRVENAQRRRFLENLEPLIQSLHCCISIADSFGDYIKVDFLLFMYPCDVSRFRNRVPLLWPVDVFETNMSPNNCRVTLKDWQVLQILAKLLVNFRNTSIANTIC